MDNRIALLLAIVAGSTFAWTHNAWQCIAILIFPVVCIQPVRQAGLLFTVFFASACAPVIWIGYSYTGTYIPPVLWYMTLVFINSAVFVISFYQWYLPKYVALPVGIVVVSVPPIAYINPASLLPTAGWLFPSTGYIGVALFLVLVGLSTLARKWGITSILAITAMSFPVGQLHGKMPVPNISALNIVRPHDTRSVSDLFRVAYRHEEYDAVRNTNTETVIFPESTYGVWNQVDGAILVSANRSILGGSREYITSTQYRNVIVDGVTGITVYEQRLPPVLPGMSEHRPVKGIGEVIDVGISFLICYEITNPIISMNSFHGLNPVVWVSNLSWFKSHYLEMRLRSVLTAWSRLFSSPFLYSVMRHD